MVSGVQCSTKPYSMRFLRLATSLCFFLLQQYSRERSHRLHVCVAWVRVRFLQRGEEDGRIGPEE